MPQRSPSAGRGRLLKPAGKSGDSWGQREHVSSSPSQERLANCPEPEKKCFPEGSKIQTEGISVCPCALHRQEQNVFYVFHYIRVAGRWCREWTECSVLWSSLGGWSDILPQPMTERPGEIKASWQMSM